MFICRKTKVNDLNKNCNCTSNLCTCNENKNANNKPRPTLNQEEAKNILAKVKSAISSDTIPFNAVAKLFTSIGIDQEKFELAYNIAGKKAQTVLKQ